MYISDVHDSNPQPSQEAKDFIAQERMKQIKSVIEQLVDDEFERLTEYADDFISNTAASRAERFLERVLKGDADAAMALLGDKMGGSRRRMVGCDEGKPWAHLIHGSLFETSCMELRRSIVEAHPELLRNERIADLESVVEGLSRQVRELERDLEQCRDRVRAY